MMPKTIFGIAHQSGGIRKTGIAVLFALTLLGRPAALPRADAAIHLKMNHQFPENTTGSRIDSWFVERVRERTDGRVIIRIFWDGRLGEPRDNLSLLGRGVLDMAAMSAGYFPEEMPLLAAPNSIPMAMDDVCQASEIMKAFLAEIPAVRQEALALGVRPLFFHVLNPYRLVTRTPVRRLSDLAGMRIRTWGMHMPELVRAAGATPVPLFLPDLRPAMERGIIDGCPFSLDLMVAYGIHETARHVTESVLWEGPSWGIWISTAAWERLSAADRRIIGEVAEEARRKEIGAVLAAEREARALLTRKGVAFHRLPEEDVARWRRQSPDWFGAFEASMAERGKGGAAGKMVDLWTTLRRKISCPASGQEDAP